MKQICYSSCSQLGCSPCGSPIVICLKNGEEITVSGAPYIDAFLVGVSEFSTHYNAVNYRYIFQYDEAQIENTALTITECMIEGVFCKGCLSKYLDWNIRNLQEQIDALR